MTFEKAARLTKGCQIFENGSGKKIIVESAHNFANKKVIVIIGLADGETTSRQWEHQDVT